MEQQVSPVSFSFGVPDTTPRARDQIVDAKGRVLRGFDHNREAIKREIAARFGHDPLLRADAAALALEEDLRHRKAAFWETPLAPMVAETFVPMDPEAASFAEVDEYVWERRTRQGEASLHVSLNGVNSAPDVSEYAEFQKEQIINGVISYGWNIEDERIGGRIGYNFGTRRAQLAREALQRSFDRFLLKGATVGGKTFRGLFNLNLTPVSGLTGGWYTFSTGTPTLNQITEDFRRIWETYLDSVYKATGDSEEAPDTLLMSDRMESFLRHAKIDTTNRTSLLDDLKASYPEIRNWFTHRGLRGAGASDKDRMILYKKDPKVLAAAVPVGYQERPMITEAYGQKIYAFGRIAPVVVHDSRMIVYADVAMSA